MTSNDTTPGTRKSGAAPRQGHGTANEQEGHTPMTTRPVSIHEATASSQVEPAEVAPLDGAATTVSGREYSAEVYTAGDHGPEVFLAVDGQDLGQFDVAEARATFHLLGRMLAAIDQAKGVQS